MTETRIPITFEFQGKNYSGHFDAVSGAAAQTWYLYIDRYYYGRLRKYQDQWVFDTNNGSQGWEQLADYFGEQVSR